MEELNITPNQRLMTAISSLGISQRKFAAMIGMSANGFNSIAKGDTKVSRVLALAAESLLYANADWIMTGKGSPVSNIKNRLDPWERLVLEKLQHEEGRIFDVLIADLESKSSPYRNALDSSKSWDEEKISKYNNLVGSLRKIMDGYRNMDPDDGQAPFRCGLMHVAGFKEDEIENSDIGNMVDPRFKNSLARIRDIRGELDILMNKD